MYAYLRENLQGGPKVHGWREAFQTELEADGKVWSWCSYSKKKERKNKEKMQ